MLYIRQRFRQGGPILIFFSLLVTAGLVLQLRTWYHNHQKYNRIESYQIQVYDLKHSMTSIDTVANKSMTLLKSIERSINAQKYKDMQKIS